MKRRGFFSRLLGLAAVPFVPSTTPKEKKNDSFVGDGLDHKCIDRWAYDGYLWGPLGPISTVELSVTNAPSREEFVSGGYSVVYDPSKSEDPGVIYYSVSRG